jgi:hypothetical protein
LQLCANLGQLFLLGFVDGRIFRSRLSSAPLTEP